MAGMKKIPCLAAARREARKVFPMVWVIILFIITQPVRGRAMHCRRKALAPIEMTWRSSFRNREIKGEAKQNPRTAMTKSTQVATLTQNQNAP